MVRMKILRPLGKTLEVWQFLIQLNSTLFYNPTIEFLGIYPNELKLMSIQNLHMSAYSSFIRIYQKQEATMMSFSR